MFQTCVSKYSVETQNRKIIRKS